jgi:glycosyltransferase involved in cell wall biosynthesis
MIPYTRRVSEGSLPETKPRLLIFIVAYNAERTIEEVLARIPHELADDYHVEVLVIDDSSGDHTFERGEDVRRAQKLPFALHVLYNPVNQGYGGNQKIGFHFAIERDFDFVALVHGDGQYAPECLPQLVRPLAAGEADAVFGSRMLEGGALRGGMPLYKYVGNKILTRAQNRLLRVHLSEFHSGYRVYSVDALRKVPFALNTNDFHFDTEIIIQLVLANLRIKELPIPTYYGDELCHVDGLKYAWNVTGATLRARIQEQLSLLYDRKFDVSPEPTNEHYVSRLDFESPHTFALDVIKPDSRVLDLGCAGGFLGAELRRRGCEVVGIDLFPLADGVELDAFYLHDLNELPLPVDVPSFDYVLMLDVIEHLASPETFLERLAESLRLNPEMRLVLSTGNIGFLLTRLLLLVGQFNYGKRGILDLTHTRLFTYAALRRVLDGAGFSVLEARGAPAPFTLALDHNAVGRALARVNHGLIRLRRQLFSYQFFVVAQPWPSLAYLLEQARAESEARAVVMSTPDRQSG